MDLGVRKPHLLFDAIPIYRFKLYSIVMNTYLICEVKHFISSHLISQFKISTLLLNVLSPSRHFNETYMHK